MMLMIGFELLGWKSQPAGLSVNPAGRLASKGDCVVLFPTNGVGLGHFTRLFAVAKRIRKQDPEVEIVFVTTMSALHLVENEGYPAYHLPGSYMFNDMTSGEWNAITEEILATVFEIHRPSVFVFDGAFPYRGMLNAIKNRKGLTNIWLRRGTFKKGATKIPVDSIEHFDLVIRPGDSTSRQEEEITFSTPLKLVEPILFADKEELYSREYVRTRLGIPQDSLVAYIQLGAGKINDIESDLQRVIRLLNEHENLQIVVGESLIGDRMKLVGDRVRVIRDYPNSLSFSGFDFAIMAGGYNSYHEAIEFALPTIFIPNTKTGMDDQVARVRIGETKGACLVLTETDESTMRDAIARLMDKNLRSSIVEACKELQMENGAVQVGKLIVSML
jgi:UDP-N-acetylglucosamine--N-acetylmuramyl-(pentapeptide) pyrophosphoryl-undecaprenol N-acetylglucosamine transferase